jgi:hypothetical protein
MPKCANDPKTRRRLRKECRRVENMLKNAKNPGKLQNMLKNDAKLQKFVDNGEKFH